MSQKHIPKFLLIGTLLTILVLPRGDAKAIPEVPEAKSDIPVTLTILSDSSAETKNSNSTEDEMKHVRLLFSFDWNITKGEGLFFPSHAFTIQVQNENPISLFGSPSASSAPAPVAAPAPASAPAPAPAPMYSISGVTQPLPQPMAAPSVITIPTQQSPAVLAPEVPPAAPEVPIVKPQALLPEKLVAPSTLSEGRTDPKYPVKTEIKTETKTETKTEIKTEVKTEVKPELKTQNKPESKTEIKPELKAGLKNSPPEDTSADVDNQPEVLAEITASLVNSNVEIQPELLKNSESDAIAPASANSEQDVTLEIKAVKISEPGTKPGKNSERKIKVAQNSEKKIKAVPNSQAETKTISKSEPEVQVEINLVKNSPTETESFKETMRLPLEEMSEFLNRNRTFPPEQDQTKIFHVKKTEASVFEPVPEGADSDEDNELSRFINVNVNARVNVSQENITYAVHTLSHYKPIAGAQGEVILTDG